MVSSPVVQSRPASVTRSAPRAPARMVSSPVRSVKSPTTVNRTTVIQKNYYSGSRRSYGNGGYGNNYYNRGGYGSNYGGGMGGGSGLGTSLLGGVAGGIGGAMLYDVLTDDKPQEIAPAPKLAATPAIDNEAPVTAQDGLLPAPEVVPPPYVLPQDAPLMMAPQFYKGEIQ